MGQRDSVQSLFAPQHEVMTVRISLQSSSRLQAIRTTCERVNSKRSYCDGLQAHTPEGQWRERRRVGEAVGVRARKETTQVTSVGCLVWDTADESNVLSAVRVMGSVECAARKLEQE
jgi:hypothetical protein